MVLTGRRKKMGENMKSESEQKYCGNCLWVDDIELDDPASGTET